MKSYITSNPLYDLITTNYLLNTIGIYVNCFLRISTQSTQNLSAHNPIFNIHKKHYFRAMSQEYYTKERNADFYQKLRTIIRKWENKSEGPKHKWFEYILLAPDLFHLLTKLLMDKAVSMEFKTKIGLVILYFISPIDLIPEAIVGPGGYIDDIALAAYMIHIMVNKIDPEVIHKHWAGNGNILIIVQNIVTDAHQMVGRGIWSKLRRKV